MKIGVYPGSFDPFTIGHLDVLKNAAGLFDVVYVAVLNNSAKSPVFSLEERVEMIDRVIESEGLKNVRSGSFSGLLVDYTKQIGAQYIIRGLRAITDFEYEFQMTALNYQLDSELETIFIMSPPEYMYLSSSIVRELASFNADCSAFVPECVRMALKEKLG